MEMCHQFSGYTSLWHHTLHSMNQASEHKQISFPLLKDFYIWKRNSKSPDANRRGMGKQERLIDTQMKFLRNYILSPSVFSGSSQVIWKCISTLVNVLNCIWVLAQGCLYLLQVFNICSLQYFKSQCRCKSMLGMRRQHLSAS